MSQTQTLYESHHKKGRPEGYSILKDDRGAFFSSAIGKNKNVLDIGCRDGALTTLFSEGNAVVGVDIDRVALARAEELGIETLSMDLMGDWSALDNRKFDAIVAGEVLEHIFFPEEVVRKICAHLTPDGIFVGSVPNAFSLKNRLRYLKGSKKYTPLSDPTHINQFSASDIENLLQRHFENVEIKGLGRYPRLAKFSANWFAFDLAFVARLKR